MSWLPGARAERDGRPCPEELELVIVPRTADVGGFEVRRVLPFRDRRMVGPFIFWDEMGPGEFLSGQGLDVKPHPHIGLSTVTFLTEGSLVHRDSLGSHQLVAPGDVNLMSAGAGIVHSERTAAETRDAPSRLAGVQSWIATPRAAEEATPTFVHAEAARLPHVDAEGAQIRVILGEAFGVRSPVPLPWDTLYLDVQLDAGARLQLPLETEERALYVLSGDIEIDGRGFPPHHMLVFRSGADVVVRATSSTRAMVLGGAVMDGPRHIWWNFVSSSRERIEQAKRDWLERRFPDVPGDEEEFIPLPGALGP